MYYLLYLTGVFVLLMIGICFDFGFGSSGLHISFSSIANFIDLYIALIILGFCILGLFCTKSFQSFGYSMQYMFGKNIAMRSQWDQELKQQAEEYAETSLQELLPIHESAGKPNINGNILQSYPAGDRTECQSFAGGTFLSS